jgi:hypothetical protein
MLFKCKLSAPSERRVNPKRRSFMSRISSIFLSLMLVGGLLCGGCGIFSGTKATPEEQAKLDRINANLPFEVMVDGKKAVVATEICAKIATPVKNDSKLEIAAANKEVVVISFFPCDKDGIVVSGGKPSLIILRGNSKTSLNATLDKKALPPGFQLMRVTAGDKTASVLLNVIGE